MKTIQDEILLVIPYVNSGQGNELELALTGWRKYCTSHIRVIVIGDYNKAIEGKAEYVSFPRVSNIPNQYNPNIDVARKLDKIYEIFHNEYDHFVLANDDEYPIKEFDWEFLSKVTYLQEAFIGNANSPANFWIHDMWKTRKELDRCKKGHMSFCNHHPFYFDMEKFHEISIKFDLANNSMIRENLYYNYYDIKPDANVSTVRLGIWNNKSPKEKFRKAICDKNIKFICNSVTGFSKELMDLISKHYESDKQSKSQKDCYDGISICISAYNAQDYIEECLDSIVSQSWFKSHDNWEILLGIDACEKTLRKVKSIIYKYKNLKVMMMQENVGTYITCNTIMKEAKYSWLLRFDSDDVMYENMVDTLFKNAGNFDMVTYDCHTDLEKKNHVRAEGQIFVKTEMFLRYGGFYNYRCGCDTEFRYRLRNILKNKRIDSILFYRRKHSDSLSQNKKTGMGSEYREFIKNYIKDVSSNTPTISLTTCRFYKINNKIVVSFTTWKKRHDCAAIMLENFKKQTLKPDKIYCWLSKDEYGGENIPKSLVPFSANGFIEIKWTDKNTFCHKRHEVFKTHFNDYVFLIDDDILYEPNYLEELYNAAIEHPNNVICWCTYKVEYEKDKSLGKITENPSMKNGLMTGISCFPPKVYPIECFEYSNIRDKLATKCDDSFIQAFLIKNDVPVYSIYDRVKKNFKSIKEYQSVGIWETENKKKINGISKKTLIFKSLIKEFNLKEKSKQIWSNIDI